MYDHIKVGDLVFLKRKINICNNRVDDTCLVLYKEKLDNEFLFNVLYQNAILIYDTSISHCRNITLKKLNK